MIADRESAAIDEPSSRSGPRGYAVEGVLLDVTDSARVTEVADARAARIDILVNNAGIARSETAAEDVADEHWLNVLDVNLNGTFWCARAFGRHMLARGPGSIVNVGSMSGFIVNRPQPQSYYNASQGGGASADQVPGRRMGVARACASTRSRRPISRRRSTPSPTARRDVSPLDRRHAAWGGWASPRKWRRSCFSWHRDAASLMTGSIVLADGGYTCW